MVRVDNWPVKFSRFLKERQAMPFEWGKNDCLMFAADCVKCLTGKDPAEKWRGYATKEEAQALLDGKGIYGLIDEALGVKSHRNYLKAQRGDVVVCKMPEPTAGVVDDSGLRIAMIFEEGGLIRIPLERAWRVWGV